MIFGDMTRFRFCLLLLASLAFPSACAGPAPDKPARIAVVGDSMMAWNGLSGGSAPQALARQIGEPVVNFAVSGARMNNPLPISSTLGFEIRRQFRKGPWKVILVNGGANDLFMSCGCGACSRTLDRLVQPDGQAGWLPDLLLQLRDTGAEVIYVGYHRARGLRSPARGCRDELDILEDRAAAFAEKTPGVSFVGLRDVFPVGDATYYASDILHPSPKGSATIAARLADYVRDALDRSIEQAR